MLAVRPSRLAVQRLGTNVSSGASQMCLCWLSHAVGLYIVPCDPCQPLPLIFSLHSDNICVLFFFTSANSVRVQPPICLC